MNEDYRQPDYRDDVPNETVPCGPLPLASVTGSAATVERTQRVVSRCQLAEFGHQRVGFSRTRRCSEAAARNGSRCSTRKTHRRNSAAPERLR